MIGIRGPQGSLGALNYYDLLAQANLQNCDPMDSACVSNNVAKQAAVEDLWANRYQVTGAPDTTKLTFTPQTPAQVLEFYNPKDLFNAGNVVDTSGIMSGPGSSLQPQHVVLTDPVIPHPVIPPPLPKAPDVVPVVVPAAAPVVASGPGASAGASVVGGGPAVGPINVGVPVSYGFDFSSIPWWGWAAVAGGAFFLFGGGRR